MLTGLSLILLWWLIGIAAISSIGRAMLRLLRIKAYGEFSFWPGFCAVLLLLQIWHLFAPVNQFVFAGFLLLGLAAFFWNRREIVQNAASFLENRFLALLALVIAIFLANRAMGPFHLFDGGLYHLTAIKWNIEYAIIPGLGNLLDRLGLNNAYFLFHALLDHIPALRSFQVVNGMLLLMLLLRIAQSFFVLIKNNSEAGLHDWFAVLLLPFTFGQALYYAEDTSPDVAVFALGAVTGLELCRFMFTLSAGNQTESENTMVLLLAATAITVKISSLAFSSVAILVILIRCRQRTLIPVAASVLFFWILGNIVLTGYILYPSSILSVHTDWRMPVEAVEEWQGWIKSDAKWPHAGVLIKEGNWVGSWMMLLFQERKRFFEAALPVFLFILGWIVPYRRVRDPQSSQVATTLSGRSLRMPDKRSLLVFVLPALVSTVFWFYQVPEPRFAGVSLWYLGAAGLAYHLCGRSFDRRILITAILTALLAVSRVYYAPLFVRPGPDHGFYPIPRPETSESVTRSGLVLHVPRNEACWESELPCTPWPSQDTRQRGQSLSGGFIRMKLLSDEP